VKGIWGATLLSLRAERYQQFGLLPAALLALCAGPVVVAVWPSDSGAASTWIFILNVALIPTLGVELMVAGVTLRAAAAFRALTLIPHSRLRLALGALVVAVLAASLVTVSAAVKCHAAPRIYVPWGSLAGTFGGTLALGTLAVLFGFLTSGGSVWSRLGWFAVALSGGPLLAKYGEHVDKRLGLGPAGGVEVVALAGAVAFAVWYSRSRLISPPQLHQTGPVTLDIFGVRPQEALGASAEKTANIYLLGQPAVLRACWPWLAFFVCNNFLYVFGIPRYYIPMAHRDWSVAFSLALLLVLTCGTFFPASILRRTRALWIRGGLSRLELFEKVEKLSLSCFLWTAGPLLAMWVPVWLHIPATQALYMLALAVSTGLCCVYLSLFDVHRSSQFNPYVLSFAVLTWALFMPHATLFLFAPDDPWEFLVPAAEIAGVLALRGIVQHRWQHIDWLICKPPRSFSQRLRAVQ
jgi:hypothetical protein